MDHDALGPIEQLELEVFVPQATDFSLQDLGVGRQTTVGQEDDEANGTLRSSDEQLTVFVILRAPGRYSDWRRHLSYLQITLEAQAFGSNNRDSDGQSSEDQSFQPQGKDVIWSSLVDTRQEPVAVNDEGGIALVWAVSCFLGRPRVRMKHPMIFFKASGILRHQHTSPEDSLDPLLPSGVPASINVLESLNGDLGLRGIRPQLTALRLDRININKNSTAKEQAIRLKPQQPFPALPALSARVRYSKAGAYTGRYSIIASLDIEAGPFQNDKIELTRVGMQLSDGNAEDLCKGHAIELPMICQPRDNIVFLFRLLPTDDHLQSSKVSSNTKTLDISIDARVLVSDACRPNIHMRWRTLVDFPTALNPKFGGPTQAMQRSKRPSALSAPSDTAQHLPQDQENTSNSSEDSRPNQRTSAHANLGLTLTLTAPKDVYVGQPFTWDVFLVNHSHKPRKLAILVIPKRKHGDHKNHISKTSVFSFAAAGQGGKGNVDHADAVMDENRLYAVQKGLGREEAGVVALTTEVRIGTLNPGFCHNMELKFLPLARGVLHIEAVRVVDLVENKSIDVRDLPEIVAEERSTDE